MTDEYNNKIGFLPYKGTLEFNNGGIYPVQDFDIIQEYINEKSNSDGYFYPPTSQKYILNYKIVNGKLETFEEPMPNTQKPAQMFKMPASHELKIINPMDINDPKNGDGLFLTYLISFIFGVRLQFHDWFFDGRISLDRKQDFVFIKKATENFMDIAYSTWRNCDIPNRILLTNLLYMQTKVKSYEWHWERFLISYMIIDGCYKYLSETKGIKSNSHPKRINTIINELKLEINSE